jgi:hypothetical protein
MRTPKRAPGISKTVGTTPGTTVPIACTIWSTKKRTRRNGTYSPNGTSWILS